MSPFLKGLLAVIGGIVVLIVVALTALVALFDPNDHKDEVQTQVAGATGRELQLTGPLSLSIFPWLGVQAENVRLANASGFTDPDMASLRKLDARLRLWPLFRGEIEIGRILIDGLVLNLERRADGSNNWEDLGSDKSAANKEPDSDSGPADLSRLRLAGVDITDARIQWRDAGAVTVIEGLNLSTGPIAEGQPSELELDVGVSLADKTAVQFALRSGWEFSLTGPSARLDRARARISVSGDAIPAGRQELELDLDAEYDGAAQGASLRQGEIRFAGQVLLFQAVLKELSGAQRGEFSLEAKSVDLAAVARALQAELPKEAGQWPSLSLALKSEAVLSEKRLPANTLALGFGPVQLSANAVVSDFTQPAASGTVHLAPLDLHALLGQLGYGLDKDKSAGPTSLDIDWALAPDTLNIKQLKGALAGEPLTGSASLKQFAKPVIRADLELAGLVLADWKGRASAAPAAQQSASKPAGGGLNELELPMDWARDLNLTARAAIRRLNAYGIKFNDVIWSADARPGQPVRQDLKASAYGGQLSMNNQIDATQPEPKIGLGLSAKAIGLGDFLKDGWGSRWISGTTELGASLSSQGSTVGALRGNTNGEANYRLQDGEVQGVSLLDLLRGASARLQGGSAQQADAQNTQFQELVGRAVIESGKLKMREIGGGSSWLKLAGDGFVDLLEGRYDLLLKPTMLDNEQVRQDKYLSKLIGLAIPVSVTGPLAAPKFKVDLEQLAKDKAQSKLDEKKDEAKDKLREKIDDKLGDFLRKR